MQIDDPYLPDPQADRRIIVYSTTSLTGEPEPAGATSERRIIVYQTTSLTDGDASTTYDGGDWLF